MMRLLRHWFRFTKATLVDLEGQPVWLVEGEWFADTLPNVLPQLKDRAAAEGGIRACDLPDGMALTRIDGDIVLTEREPVWTHTADGIGSRVGVASVDG